MVLDGIRERSARNNAYHAVARQPEKNRKNEEVPESDSLGQGKVNDHDIASAFGRADYSLIVPLYDRALVAQAAPELFQDSAAETFIRQFAVTKPKKEADGQSYLRAFAHYHYVKTAEAYLRRHARTCVVDLGCGMDTLFYQLDDMKLRWINIDFEETLRLRRSVGFDQEGSVEHIAGDPSDTAWFCNVGLSADEGLIVVVDEQVERWTARAVKELVVGMREHYPGSLLMLSCSGGRGARDIKGFHLHDLNAKSVFRSWLDDTTTRVYETVRIPQEILRHIQEPARKDVKRRFLKGKQILVDIEY